MPGRIPQSFIDDLLARVDIVDVIDARVPLKKQGSNYMACCPFHEEKTPSFSVSPTKQFYYCFGCGASGTALGFLMEHDRLHFVEAVENLAASVGLEVPREGGEAGDGHQPLYRVLDEADRYYRAALRKSEAAIDYLKQRGISGRTAANFGLGHAPPGWNNLTDQGIGGGDTAILLAAGLLNRNESERIYDRFRNRIMFPIRDRRGRTIAFGARVLDDATPKYLNSPETAVFHKGRELYGLYEARQPRRKLERLLVVEGYMDVVMLAEHGIDYAVATLGTAVSEHHIERLFATVAEVVFCFDGDDAGRQAAWRALTNTLPMLTGGREARFLFLDEGEDPDSTVAREGREAFERRLDSADSLTDFLIKHLTEGIDVNTPGGGTRVVSNATPLISRIGSEVYRELLIDRLASEIHINPDVIKREVDRASSKSDEKVHVTPPKDRITFHTRNWGVRKSLMQQIISLLIQNPEFANDIPSDHAIFDSNENGADLLREIVKLCQKTDNLTTAHVLEAFRDSSNHKILLKLATYEFPTANDDDQDCSMRDVFESALERIAVRFRQARFRELHEIMEKRKLSDDEYKEYLDLRQRK
ncbi:MAG: DNA primase [Halofilum sp. (in: g-proteobacteria)]|nr:DNA primase [Halofilum sp. (in: g-proteobacteria)]